MTKRSGILALPLMLWLVWFLVMPIAFVLIYSLLQRGSYGEIIWTLTFDNYLRALDPLYFQIFVKSLLLTSLTTILCLALGLPLAYTIATAAKRWRPLLISLLMLPFLTNFIVRVYAIRLILGGEGPINAVLVASGLVSNPVIMTDSLFAVAVGMLANYLPFMTLPIYVVLEKMDFSLLEAAADLGARRLVVLTRVILPISMPGIMSGTLLVFVPVLGEYMIPDLLGGAKTMLLGNLITEQFLKVRDWPFGAALAMLLILVMLASFALQRLIGGKGGRLVHP
jgi:spermidine/putrescine transport system permease protein